MHNGPKTAKPRERDLVSELIIREMELDDLPIVYALGEKLFKPDLWPTLYRTWDEYELVDLFASDGDTCIVAELDERVVGFALGTVIQKRRSAWTYGYLLWIGVDPDAGRRGIGARLLDRITDLFIEHGARMMLVDTDAENGRALAFFRAQGFGNEMEHVYLSKNLTRHPVYVRKRKRSTNAREAHRKPAPKRAPPPGIGPSREPDDDEPGDIGA